MLPVLALLRAEVGFSGGELGKDGVHMVCLGRGPHKATDEPRPQGVPHQGVREHLELLEGLRHEVRVLSLPFLHPTGSLEAPRLGFTEQDPVLSLEKPHH